MALEIRNISKAFGDKQAVNDLSFTVEQGKVYGLLGLNGAGKSTTIRMILDILQPDNGEILWLGVPTNFQLAAKFGYLPEERGLYQQMKVMSHLLLFGQLRGMSKTAATAAAQRWLTRFEIAHYANRAISELSKGNQQKVQFIASVLHNPEVVILDEPFSGLDPVNTAMFMEVFHELVDNGKTVLFSSHRLDHVEELSDAVGIIHQSSLVLSGTIEEILSAAPARRVRIGTDIEQIKPYLSTGTKYEMSRGLIEIDMEHVDPKRLLQELVANHVDVTHFELVRPSLNDIFLEKVGKSA